MRNSVAPMRNSVAPTRGSVAPTRSSVALTRSNVAPTRSNVAPTRSNVAPTRSNVAPPASPPGGEGGQDLGVAGHRLAGGSVQPDVGRLAGGVEALAAAVAQLIGKAHHPAADGVHRGPNQHFVIVSVRSAVTAGHLGHDQQ